MQHIDLTTQRWSVMNDGSALFKDAVIKWLNERESEIKFTGTNLHYFYGSMGNGELWYSASPFGALLSIDQFIETVTDLQQEYNPEIINAGSVEDIRCTLKHHEDTYSLEQLTKELEAEKSKFNRATVIKMLERAIKRKNKANGKS